jgi:hypothetical protein
MKFDGMTTATGGFFVLSGGAFLIEALRNLTIGTAFQMGPGYFPALIAALLIIVGLGLVGVSLTTRSDPDEAFGKISWRSVGLIVAAPIFFALMIRGIGILGTVFATSLLTSLADRAFDPWHSLALAAVLAIGSYLIFSWALGLPLPAFGSWLV